jgi:hypothetical protein
MSSSDLSKYIALLIRRGVKVHRYGRPVILDLPFSLATL